MRIIEAGKLPELEVKRLKCNHCACVFECTKGEMKGENDRNQMFYWIACPTCNNRVWSN